MKRIFVTCLAAAFSLQAAWAETLTIYTYESFVSDWGPGPEVQKRFESQCGCTIEWVAEGDAATLLTALRLEGDAGRADVVLGLDTNLMAEAVQSGVVLEHGLGQLGFDLPIAWIDPVFVPFDYGYFAIVYDSATLTDPPASLAELASESTGRDLIIQDPRTSTPDLAFCSGSRPFTATMRPRPGEICLNVSDGNPGMERSLRPVSRRRSADGAELYDVSGVSPAGRKRDPVQGSDLSGRPLHADRSGCSRGIDRPAGTRTAVSFICRFTGLCRNHSATNWMYPATDAGDALPDVFRDLAKPEVTLLLAPEEVAANRKEWMREWLEAVGTK